MKERSIDLVSSLRHSIPYINAHRGKTFVIQFDGDAILHENFNHLINDIGLLHSLGIRLIIVYGARPQIEKNLVTHALPSLYHKQIRITDDATLEVIKQSVGQIQLNLTAKLSMNLTNTPLQGAHLHIVSGNFVTAQPIGVDDGVDYCLTGCIRRIDTEAIRHQLTNNAIILQGPIAVSVTGESFNLTCAEVATQMAIKLKADKLIVFGSTQGIINDNQQVISEILPNQIEHYLSDFSAATPVNQEVISFLRSAREAGKQGVPRCHFISYQENGVLLQELFSREGIGTQTAIESSEQLRKATIHDIGGILKLISPLEQQGTLVRRSREQLEREIEQFVIIELDNVTIACAALYPFLDEAMAEMACVAVHPDYRNSARGEMLLQQISQFAIQLGLKKLFVLTTRSIHWFQERGFQPAEIQDLPIAKQRLYNYQRKSKILILDL